MAGFANTRSALRLFGPNTAIIGQTSVPFGLRFLARGFCWEHGRPLSGASGSAWSWSPPPLSDSRRVPLVRSPILRGPVFLSPGLRGPVFFSPGLRSPPNSSPILGSVQSTVVREAGVPLGAFRLFGLTVKTSGRPGSRIPVRWTAHARSSGFRHPARRNPRPCFPFPRSPRVGAKRPFAVRDWPDPSFGLRSFAGALFRSPAFSGGLESPETGCSVRPKARIKSTARTRTRDLQVLTLAS